MNVTYRFACDGLSGGPLRVLAFSCEEQLGRPYTLEVLGDLGAELGDLEGVLGKPGTLSFDDMRFHGVVFGIDLLLAAGDRRVYRLTLAPELHALSIGRHSRVFVDRSVPEVIEQVLRDGGLSAFELRLSGAYEARRHMCQYKESDLDFLHRWMEREGIYYYFLQEEGGARLVVCDDRSRHGDAPSARVRYFPSGRDDASAGECFAMWRREHAGVTAGVRLGDYDYLRPALRVEAVRREAALGFEELVRFEDNLPDQREADRLAAIRAEALKAAQTRFHGSGRVGGLHAGLRFRLDDHPRGELNQRYQICRVVHRSTLIQGDPTLVRYLGLPPAEAGYHVSVEALPAEVQYRPERRTAWPEVRGVESAVVDGEAESPYAQIDGHGRYRVRFLFDEAKNPAGGASAWLRMMQPHGGSPEGHHFPLRKGTEVLVAFVHGDPDRPFIAGAAPTPATPSPVTSANPTRNVVQTGGLSRLEVEDREGGQYIDLSTPPQRSFLHLGARGGLGDHNIVLSTEGDGLHHAGGKRDITVGGAQAEDVAGDVIEEYGANQGTHVSGSFTETIGAGMTQTISSGAAQTIDGGLNQSITGGEMRTVNGDVVETLNDGRTQDIVGSTKESIGGSLTQTATGFIGVSTPATYTLNAPASLTMMTPAAGMVKGISGVTLIAPGGQTTVDQWYQGIGDQHVVMFFIKATAGMFSVAATIAWLRIQFMHVAVYGIKLDTKIFDVKLIPDEKLYGVLSARAFAAKAKKAGLTQIGGGPGPGPGAPGPGPGAPGPGPGAPGPGPGAPGPGPGAPGPGPGAPGPGPGAPGPGPGAPGPGPGAPGPGPGAPGPGPGAPGPGPGAPGPGPGAPGPGPGAPGPGTGYVPRHAKPGPGSPGPGTGYVPRHAKPGPGAPGPGPGAPGPGPGAPGPGPGSPGPGTGYVPRHAKPGPGSPGPGPGSPGPGPGPGGP
ncbi:type VI secretion system Vgr family protein [Sorangium sp. So ce341]|uniref:type VI secretion system Vgr family protein n=1 Tax=Sorangium sp. So ce341 TaxID=3133302 RepID=UPI003F624D8F